MRFDSIQMKDILLIARSLSSSSALSALMSSTKLTSGYSVPMTGVTSMEVYLSRVPVDLSGSLKEEALSLRFARSATLASSGEVCWTADGAMIVREMGWGEVRSGEVRGLGRMVCVATRGVKRRIICTTISLIVTTGQRYYGNIAVCCHICAV